MVTAFDFLPEIVGSLVGVVVGFYLGIRLERRMRAEESREGKRDYLNGIIKEVENNRDRMDTSKTIPTKLQDGKQISYYAEHLSTESLVSGIYSGEFRAVSIRLQTKLSEYLRYCNYVNSTINALNFATQTDIQTPNLAKQNRHYFGTLKKFIPQLLEDLN